MPENETRIKAHPGPGAGSATSLYSSVLSRTRTSAFMDATVYDMFASFKWSMIEFCPMMIEVACKMLLNEYNRAFRGSQ